MDDENSRTYFCQSTALHHIFSPVSIRGCVLVSAFFFSFLALRVRYFGEVDFDHYQVLGSLHIAAALGLPQEAWHPIDGRKLAERAASQEPQIADTMQSYK